MAADLLQLPLESICTCCGCDVRGQPLGSLCPDCGMPTGQSLIGEPRSAEDPPELSAGVVCISCGYDLRALPMGGLCPECGTPTGDSLVGEPPSEADAPVIPTGVVCIACGYDLRRPPQGGACLECGTPISHSLAGGPLPGGDGSELPAGVVCITCGYDLRRLPQGRACPECGTPTSHSFAGEPPPRGDGPPLPAGVVCIRCGYDLRALPMGGWCPECGTPTEHSPGGDPLSRADPPWLARIAVGQAVLAWGLSLAWLGAIMFGFLPIGLYFIVEAGHGGNTYRRMMEMAPVTVTGCAVLGMMMCLVGAFLLTTREPKKRARKTRSSSRQCARQGMVAAIGGVWIILAVGLAPLAPGTLNWIRTVLYVFCAVAAVVAAGAILRFLAGLAARIPDRKLLRRTNNSMQPLCWAILVLVAMGLLTLVPAAQLAGGKDLMALGVWLAGIGCAGPIVLVLLVVQMSRLLVLMHAFRRALRRCRDAAAA